MNKMNKKIFKIFVILTFSLLLIVSFVSCSNVKEEQFYAMGTYIEIKVEGKNSKQKIEQIKKVVLNLDNMLSVSIEKSDISKINNAKADQEIKIQKHTMCILAEAKKFYEESNKKLNVGVLDLVELWGFKAGANKDYRNPIKRPEDIKIKEAQKNICLDDLELNEKKLTVIKKNANLKIDLGAIAKGYITDKVKDIIDKKDKAIINIGGNLYLLGKTYKVGIQDPRDENEYFAVVQVQNQSIVTSGDYERYYINADNPKERFCHIIDPDTGAPVNNGMIAVSVIGDNSCVCDALSTILMLLGKDEGAEFLKKYYKDYKAVMVYEKDEGQKVYKKIGDFDLEITSTNYKEDK